MMLRNAYYYPIFIFCLILLIAAFLLMVSQIAWLISEGCERCIANRRQAKLFLKQPARVRDPEDTGRDGPKEVEWDFRDQRAWEERMSQLRKGNIDLNITDLSKFA